MKVDIKPILYTKSYKVFGDDVFLGYVSITPDDKWLYRCPSYKVCKEFDSYDEMYEWLKWSDY